MARAIHFLAYPTPLRNDKGELLGAVNMLIDITERKRNEEAAQRTSPAIVRSSRATPSFLQTSTASS